MVSNPNYNGQSTIKWFQDLAEEHNDMLEFYQRFNDFDMKKLDKLIDLVERYGPALEALGKMYDAMRIDEDGKQIAAVKAPPGSV